MPCSMSKLLAPLVGVAFLPLATCFSSPALPGASARHVASMTPLAGRVPLRPATRPASLGLFMADETAVENAREFVAADLTVEKFWAMSIGKWKGLRSSHNIAFAQLGIVLRPALWRATSWLQGSPALHQQTWIQPSSSALLTWPCLLWA